MGISLTAALIETEDPKKSFDIKYVAIDLNRKTGGKIIELKDCRRVGASHSMKENDTISVKQNNRTRHPYTIHNHLILEVNGQQVFI